jgi:hypothetical protein
VFEGHVQRIREAFEEEKRALDRDNWESLRILRRPWDYYWVVSWSKLGSKNTLLSDF